MAHADPAGVRKRPTQKTKSTRHKDAFLYDFSLPTVPLSSALDPKLPPDPVESHKSGTPLGAAQARTPQQLCTGDLASPDYLTQRISLVQAEREKLALELELLRLKREQPPPAGQDNRGCKPWNYTGSCTCEKEKEIYSSQHKCRVCQQDHPMLHCPKRRNPIPATF